MHSIYTLTFDIKDNSISVSPVIYVFKENWYKIYTVNMDIEIYKNGEVWDANVKIEVNGSMVEETFEDIENNPIELRW